MIKNNHYKFQEKHKKILPLQYNYFEEISGEDALIMVKWHKSKVLTTDKMYVYPLYKHISRMF